MKIRIKGDSLRLRLMQDEVTQLMIDGRVADCIHFGRLPGDELAYTLVRNNTDQICAIYSGNRIEIQVPDEVITKWAKSDQTSIEESIDNGVKGGLRLLIEKDFACLTDRPNEDESQTFPNPNSYC
jgi:hypothetical protein